VLLGFYYRDKKVVGVTVDFRAPLQWDVYLVAEHQAWYLLSGHSLLSRALYVCRGAADANGAEIIKGVTSRRDNPLWSRTAGALLAELWEHQCRASRVG
jgi:hypothetical protein